jgi:hypothetical protein
VLENVKFMRNAAADGSYDNILAMLSAYGR